MKVYLLNSYNECDTGCGTATTLAVFKSPEAGIQYVDDEDAKGWIARRDQCIKLNGWCDHKYESPSWQYREIDGQKTWSTFDYELAEVEVRS